MRVAGSGHLFVICGDLRTVPLDAMLVPHRLSTYWLPPLWREGLSAKEATVCEEFLESGKRRQFETNALYNSVVRAEGLPAGLPVYFVAQVLFDEGEFKVDRLLLR